MEEEVEATEILHNPNDQELYFRFIGTAKSRQFVVNVQFQGTDNATGEQLRPEEFDFMISKVLRLVLGQIGNRPNPALN
jgi:hypothetical protein